MLKMAPALTVSTHSERGAWILKKTTIKLTFPGKCTVSAGTPLTPLPVPYLPLRKALFGTELTRIGLVELPNTHRCGRFPYLAGRQRIDMNSDRFSPLSGGSFSETPLSGVW